MECCTTMHLCESPHNYSQQLSKIFCVDELYQMILITYIFACFAIIYGIFTQISILELSTVPTLHIRFPNKLQQSK